VRTDDPAADFRPGEKHRACGAVIGAGGAVFFYAAAEFAECEDDDTIIELYAGALGVVFPPYDEDYGYVTLEAFLAGKPVITTTDAGGPNEFVVDRVNGRVTPPDPEAIGDAISDWHRDRIGAAAMGDAGFDRARTVTWAGVIDQLVGR